MIPGYTCRYLGALLVACLGLTACGRTPEPSAVVRIGVILPMAGPSHNDYGKNVQKAARLMAAEVNAAGGLDVGGTRHRVELLFEDSADNPDRSLEAARKLVNQDEVVALVGPLLSRNAFPVATLAERQGIPMITPGATDPSLTEGKRFIFRVTTTDDFQARCLARFAREDLGIERAAVLFDVASRYNRSLATVFREIFTAEGGEVVAFETYTTGEMDFRPHLARIQEADPQVLFLPNYYDEVRGQARMAREMGITATMLGGDAWEGEVMAAEEIFAGSFFVDHWHPAVANTAAQAFINQYRASYGYNPASGELLVHDAFQLIFAAIESQGSLDGAQIRSALAEMKAYQGGSGTISHWEGGDPVRGMVMLVIEQGAVRLHKHIMP